jgi:methionyl-tRNA formyltransferase
MNLVYTKHLQNIIFAGTPTIAAHTLEQLIQAGINITACYTQPDRPKGRGQTSCCSPVKSIGLDYQIPIFQPETLKDPNSIKTLQQLQPDLIIVFAYGLIFPAEVLKIPTFGCINIHTSLLPRWRGAAPTQHAILAGDNITGITIINMEPSLDTGAILYSINCPIANNDTNESLLNKLQPLAITAILEVLKQLNTNQTTHSIQDETLATYAKKIDKTHAKINWKLSAIEIERAIRAFIREPVAFTQLGDPNNPATFINNIKIWQATVKPNHNYSNNILAPGNIIINKNNIEVATGHGVLQLEKIQFPGGKIQSVADLLHSPKYKQLFETHAKFN